jgi:hypothetical protein
MAEVGFEAELVDSQSGEVLLQCLVFDDEQFKAIKQANERGTLKVRTIITETQRREV